MELEKEQKLEEMKKHFGPWSVWSYPEVGNGWIDLIYDVHCQIVEIDPDYKIIQIKQKLKGLRYYVESKNDPRIDAIIRAAEDASFEICEYCSAHVDFNGEYLGMTLCSVCQEGRSAGFV